MRSARKFPFPDWNERCHSPTQSQWKSIAEDLKEEVKKRKVCPFWRGRTIPSNFKSFFVDENLGGALKKIFLKNGTEGNFLQWNDLVLLINF
jgi:hypothetical protein